MWVLKASRRSARRCIQDVVGAVRTHTSPRGPIQPRGMAHPIGYRVIRAGCVAADAKSADNLLALIQGHAAAESDDAARHEPDARTLGLECRVERIRVIQSIERAAG